MTPRTAEVAGGGIGGLAIGWALAAHGWKVRIHERQPAIREIGAGILLMRNSLSIFERHGIGDIVLRRAVPLVASERLDHEGRSIQRMEFRPEERWVCLPRADLVNGLAEVARNAGAEIITGSEAVSADPSGIMTFADGSQAQADLLIVADGFHSRLRDRLGMTACAYERDTGATRLLMPRAETERIGAMMEYWSGKRRVGVAACTSDLTYVYLSCPHADARGSAVPLDIVSWQEAFPALRGLFERARHAERVVRHSYAYGAAKTWSKGRVAIIGDAAHAFPPTLGQGAGLAIANGYALVRELQAGGDIETVLTAWERKYRRISDQTQIWSARIDALTARWPKHIDHVRRLMIWGIGHLAWLNRRVRIADNFIVT